MADAPPDPNSLPASNPEVWLVRHGPTEWSESGQHTGRTDLALTDAGREVARRLEPALRDAPSAVVCSPLRRAVETAELSGLTDWTLDDDLMEWDYGEAEGVSTAAMRETVPGWSVWTHPLAEGESLDEVATRADRAIKRILDTRVDTLVVAHGQFLRIFGARWCGLDPMIGRHLALDTAAISRLGWHREDRVIERWNESVDRA